MKIRLGLALFTFFYAGLGYSHDTIPKPVREGTFDFRCVGPTGEISKHTSLHTAINACQSKKLLDPTKKYVVEAGPLRMDLPTNTPVDCIGIWTAYTKVPGSEGICNAGTRSITEQRTFTIVTPASNGGLVCPSSPQTRQSVEPCTMPAVNCEGTWSEYIRISGSETACINNQRNFTEQRIFNILTPPSNGGTACPTSPESRQLSEPCNISSNVLPDTNSPVLSISPNGRFFRLDGSPYFWVADTGWTMAQGNSDSDITKYLEDRASKGVRIIQGPILVASNVKPPYIGDADDPFIPGSPMKLNESWWRSVDHTFKEAARLRLVLFPALIWGSSNDEVFQPGQELQHAEFAKLVAKRYSNQANIHWIAAGEYHKIRYDLPDSSGNYVITPIRPLTESEKHRYNLVTEALKNNTNQNSMIVYHPDGWQQTSVDFGTDTRVAFNMLQSSRSLHENLRRVPLERSTTPIKPVVEAETDYEGNGAPDYWQRLWAYNTFMQGAAGYTYGHSKVWNFQKNIWQTALNTTASNEVFNYFNKFVQEHHHETNTPAQNLISDVGNISDIDNSYATALLKGDKTKLIVYVTNGRTLQVNTSSLAPGNLKARWYNTRLGTYQNTVVNRSNNAVIDPPGSAMEGNDWVIVIESTLGEVPQMSILNNLKGQWDVNTRGRTDNTFREWINGVNSTLSGTTSLDTSGNFDGINFNGSTGYARHSLPAGLSSTFADSDYTIAARVKLDTVNPGWMNFVGAYNSPDSQTRVEIGSESGTGDVIATHTNQAVSSPVFMGSSSQLDDGNDHVVVLRRSGNVFSLWADGVKVDEQTVTAGTVGTLDRITFGRQDNSNPQSYFDGTVRWAAIWDNDLTDQEIAHLHATENPFATAFTPPVSSTIPSSPIITTGGI